MWFVFVFSNPFHLSFCFPWFYAVISIRFNVKIIFMFCAYYVAQIISQQLQEMLNLVPKSCVLNVGSLCVSQTQCCEELMPTIVHRNSQLTFSCDQIHHSLSYWAENCARLCETKKAELFDEQQHQNNEWLNHFPKFFRASGLTLFELVRNRLNKKI